MIDVDLMIIGAPKCGTSTLFQTLVRSSRISRPKRREMHYFDHDIKHHDLSWYNELVAREPDTLGLDRTGYYFIHPHVPNRIVRCTKKMKFIVLLRNPADRAYSWYTRGYHKDVPSFAELSFEECLEAEERELWPGIERFEADDSFDDEQFMQMHWLCPFKLTGLYAQHLKRWFSVFSQKHFCIITLDQIRSDVDGVIKQMCKFLRIPTLRRWENPINRTRYEQELSPKTRRQLVDYFRQPNEELSELISQRLDWNDCSS